MNALWPDTAVDENNLTQNISTLRRLLGEVRKESRFILTVPGHGYRFIAKVQEIELESPPLIKPVKLGVLPFDFLGVGAELEYLADGLTEETIAALGQVDPEHFCVIGRTSMLRYKSTNKSLAEIGAELDTSFLVESSIRSESGRLRITSKLIRTRDQVQVWSASYDREPSSLLAFQQELSAVIAEQVRLRLSSDRVGALARRQTRDPEAHDLYLHGRHYWHQLSPPTTRRAIDFFTKATILDPNYALAWSGIADVLASTPINGDASPLEVLPRAREAALRAVHAGPDIAEAQTSLGFVNFWLDWDWVGAEAAFKKAIELDANYPLPHRMLGLLYVHSGNYEAGKLAMRRARELDPLLAVHHALSAQTAFLGRDFEVARQFARQTIAIDPEFWVGYLQLAQACAQLGECDAALEALNRAVRLSDGNTKAISLRGFVLARLGRTAEARDVLAILEMVARDRYIPPYALALVHAGLGENEQAVAGLERALAARDVHLIFLPTDAKWDLLRSNPQFVALLRRCEFANALPSHL